MNCISHIRNLNPCALTSRLMKSAGNSLSHVTEGALSALLDSLQRVPLKNPRWVFTAGWDKLSSALKGSPSDPTLPIRQKIQEIIERKSSTEDELSLIKELSALLDKPLPNGELPLNYAVRVENIPMIKLLLSMNISCEKADSNHQSALKLSMVLKNNEIISIFYNSLLPILTENIIKAYLEKPEIQAQLNAAKENGTIETVVTALNTQLSNAAKEHLNKAFQGISEASYGDPLAISYSEYITFAMAVTTLVLSASGNTEGVLSSTSGAIGYFVQSFPFMQLMGSLGQSHGYAIHMGMTIASQFTYPWVATLYSVAVKTMYAASIADTVKVALCNWKCRPKAVIRRLAVDSVNCYAYLNKIFDRGAKEAATSLLARAVFQLPVDLSLGEGEDCSSSYTKHYHHILKGIQTFLHPDRNKHPEATNAFTAYQNLHESYLAEFIKHKCPSVLAAATSNPVSDL